MTDDEIVLGTAQDLSGPIVSLSKPVVNGMLMRVDEINAAGGIHGRKLRLVVEDHGYDPKKAVLAAQKMTQRDKIFATVGSIGTPTALAAMPIYEEKNVPHLFPLTGARQMFEPLNRLKYSFSAPYYEQMRAAVKYLVKQKGYKKVCTLYQDDDFGLEVMRGGEAALKDLGMQYAERTTYKRGATDFSSQVSKMKTAGCELRRDGHHRARDRRHHRGRPQARLESGLRRQQRLPLRHHPQAGQSRHQRLLRGLHDQRPVRRRPLEGVARLVRRLQGQVRRGPDHHVGLRLSDHRHLRGRGAESRAQPHGGLAHQRAARATRSRPTCSAPTSSKFSKTSHLGSDRARLCQIQNERWVPVSEYLIH